jgi:hypothetical protein
MTDTSANKSIKFPSTGGQCNSHALADYLTKKSVIVWIWRSTGSFDESSAREVKKVAKDCAL